MKEYIVSVGVVAVISSFIHILLPEGGLRRCASLAAGFMMILAVLSPIKIEMPQLSSAKEGGFELDLSAAQSKYQNEILKKHRENLQAAIEQKMNHKGRASVTLDKDAAISEVTLYTTGDESAAVEYIVSTLSVARERITIINENN